MRSKKMKEIRKINLMTKEELNNSKPRTRSESENLSMAKTSESTASSVEVETKDDTKQQPNLYLNSIDFEAPDFDSFKELDKWSTLEDDNPQKYIEMRIYLKKVDWTKPYLVLPNICFPSFQVRK